MRNPANSSALYSDHCVYHPSREEGCRHRQSRSPGAKWVWYVRARHSRICTSQGSTVFRASCLEWKQRICSNNSSTRQCALRNPLRLAYSDRDQEEQPACCLKSSTLRLCE